MYKYFILSIITLISCQTEKLDHYSDTILRYEVNYKGDSLMIGKLNYKEIKVFNAENQLISKKTFDKSGKEKGQEIISYKGENATSEYRLLNDQLLSKYLYKYKNGFLLEKKSFNGTNEELLRIEQFSYDDNGNQTEKIIMTADKIISRVFKFAYDKFGNELGFSVFDDKGALKLIETYKITETDDQNRWTKKWTERDSLIRSYYERKIEEINN